MDPRNFGTYRIEEVDSEAFQEEEDHDDDESDDDEHEGAHHFPMPPPRAFGAASLSSGGGADDGAGAPQVSFSDIAKKIQKPTTSSSSNNNNGTPGNDGNNSGGGGGGGSRRHLLGGGGGGGGVSTDSSGLKKNSGSSTGSSASLAATATQPPSSSSAKPVSTKSMATHEPTVPMPTRTTTEPSLSPPPSPPRQQQQQQQQPQEEHEITFHSESIRSTTGSARRSSSSNTASSSSGSGSGSSFFRKQLPTVHSGRSLASESSHQSGATTATGLTTVAASNRRDNKKNTTTTATAAAAGVAVGGAAAAGGAGGATPAQQYHAQHGHFQSAYTPTSSPRGRSSPGLERAATAGGPNNNNTKRANLLASRLASRTTKTRKDGTGRGTVRGGGPGGLLYGGNNNNANANADDTGGINGGFDGVGGIGGGGGVSGGPGGAGPSYGDNGGAGGGGGATATTRRYKPGDHVLVCNQQSRWSTLVNRYGFPPGEGATPEEMRGPYIYALATVKQVHFEEFAAYYTVTRADTGAEQRADADFMEPIRTQRGEQAAFRAALQSSLEQGEGQTGDHPFVVREMGADANNLSPHNKVLYCLENACFLLILPFLWVYDYLYYFGATCLAPIGRFLKRHARLILMGMEPYACQLRLTAVNFLVLCSFWYMFIDQARLALFAPRSDFAIAVVNFIVWLVLLLELCFEVFIRPEGYQMLIVSEKAFSPQTVRYINGFHLGVELLSLALFVPEFYCIFTTDSCSERFSFSLFNAALMAVTGPTRTEAFYGRSYFALIRLRVFGVVRHWKTMWITNTFLLGRKRNESGFWNNIFPQRASGYKQAAVSSAVVVQHHNPKAAHTTTSGSGGSADGEKAGGGGGTGGVGDSGHNKDHGDDTTHDNNNHKNDHSRLTNASNIGTALMVTNSYRAISLLWVITGVFPIFAFSLDSRVINDLSYSMTEQLQATNLIATDTTSDTCNFLFDSVYAWIQAVVAPDADDNVDDPYLVTLEVLPERCNVTGIDMCLYVAQQTGVSASLCEQRAALGGQSREQMADTLGLRVGAIVQYKDSNAGINFTNSQTNTNTTETFAVISDFDQSYSIGTAAAASLLLQLCLLICVLGGLSVLRRDAEILVLGPLRRMLKIVARYARNPLVTPRLRRTRSSRRKLSQRMMSRDDDSLSSSDSDSSDSSGGDGAWRNDHFALGGFETEQLVAAVTKITDLLRKCWGVAGADIISTNLATREGALTEVFNPTVPGKSVYALFAFAAINEFDHALRNLGGDVMILINNVASVLHGEVFRWGFGESGQCNKNLGGAFLMVFRIGLVKEVIKKLEEATDVIFSGTKASQAKATQVLTRRRANKMQQQQTAPSLGTVLGQQNRRGSSNTVHSLGSASSNPTSTVSSGDRSRGTRADGMSAARTTQSFRRLLKVQRSASVKAMSLSLASLPGISTFTDRAVIGMLKSFASIHRDTKLRNWNKDPRLGPGVGGFTVSMIYGMDAGWAVEGAVGSEYKIDATYLSPHVNMASRMMSACKQYGVSILLSQAVQELMSDVAQSRLRHLDTVTVKGSSIKQKIFTYDARHEGTDFFLHSRTDEQADGEADAYTPNIWLKDADLNAMRQHVTEEFLQEFEEGRKMFLLGEWSVAKRRLEKANELMVENAIEEGYLEAELEEIMNQAANPAEAAEELKRQNGDGPSQYLLNFINSHGGNPPPVWEGWHPLNRK